MALNLKTLATRSLTAAVFVVVLLGCIFWNYYSFSVLFLAVSVWGLWEFYSLMEKLNTKPNKALGIATGIVLYLWSLSSNAQLLTLFNLEFKSSVLLAVAMIFVFLIFITQLFKNETNPFANIAATITGIIYVSVPFALINFTSYIFPQQLDPYTELPFFPFVYSPTIIFGIFLLIWSNDTFAYLVGSLIGKNKMYERISPGKTWEGTIGGGILTIGSAFLISNWFKDIERMDWIVLALIVAVIGTIGDLIESMLKRSAGVKDSGKIMPGHGGILDRFDSLILATPFIFTYLYLTR